MAESRLFRFGTFVTRDRDAEGTTLRWRLKVARSKFPEGSPQRKALNEEHKALESSDKFYTVTAESEEALRSTVLELFPSVALRMSRQWRFQAKQATGAVLSVVLHVARQREGNETKYWKAVFPKSGMLALGADAGKLLAAAASVTDNTVELQAESEPELRQALLALFPDTAGLTMRRNWVFSGYDPASIMEEESIDVVADLFGDDEDDDDW